MFSKLINWVREAFGKLFSKDNLAAKLNIDISVSNKMIEAIDLWCKLYHNLAPWLDSNVKSLNLAASIAGELARLVTIEMKSELTGSPRADYLNIQYQKVIDNVRIYTEYACAKGGLIFKPYISGKEILVDYVQADSFFPTSFDSVGNVTGAIFVEQKVKGRDYYTRLEHHNFTGTACTITNRAYKSDNSNDLGREIALTDVDEWQSLLPSGLVSNIDRPLFAYFKMPFANSIDAFSPLGVSVYSKAIDLIKEADKQYSRLLWEFEGSELAIDADSDYLKPKEGGFKLPKSKERLFRGLDTGSNVPFYNIFSPAIRDSSIINGLNELLRKIEFLCGLAYGTLSNVQDVDKTATEIKSSKQRSYATVADIQKSLKDALVDLAYIMDVYATLGKLAPNGKYEPSFEFDDSIIVDTESEQKIRLQEVAAGLLKPEAYLMWRYGVTIEQALEMLPGMKELTDKE